MKTPSLILLILAIAALVSLFSIWFYPSSQDFMFSNSTWNGIRDFSRRFNVEQLSSLKNLPSASESEKDVLIIIPNLEYNTADLLLIKQYVEQGGNLLLMDDFGYGNDVLAVLGSRARFDNSVLLDPLFCYKSQYLPFAVDFSPELREEGVSVVGLNHATVLHLEDESEALAWSSGTGYLDANNNGQFEDDEPSGPFAIAARFGAGKGSITLVSDPSLIINAMSGQEDNTAFISRLISADGQAVRVILDHSHLEKSTLDVSRDKLDSFRQSLSSPYILLGLSAAVFVLVIAYTLRKGEILGK
ncbi:MAG: hypothetical protein JXA46_04030 [Dehalococcoidales bacterium]|nr:hypothetical protein [Dehalococcoidales bacterium]